MTSAAQRMQVTPTLPDVQTTSTFPGSWVGIEHRRIWMATIDPTSYVHASEVDG